MNQLSFDSRYTLSQAATRPFLYFRAFFKDGAQWLVFWLFTFQMVSATHAETVKPAEINAVEHAEQSHNPPFINSSLKLPENLPVPGGIAVVPLNIQHPQRPTVRFGSREVFVVPYQNQWHAVVGLPIDILPGNYILGTLDHEEETGKVDMQVISLPPPTADAEERTSDNQSRQIIHRGAIPIQLEAALASSDINRVMRVPDELLEDDRGLTGSFVFTPVVESEQMIPFGKILQQKKIISHNYVSYIAASGAQVYAPAPGIVVRVIENAGESTELYIHHGGGIVSVLGNLEKILVQEGQRLDRGEQVGKADVDGSLNRSRVDLGISLNGFLVDPLQFPSSP